MFIPETQKRSLDPASACVAAEAHSQTFVRSVETIRPRQAIAAASVRQAEATPLFERWDANPPDEPWGYPIKRGIDIVGSAIAIVFLAPLLLAVALLIWALDPGPILYLQERVGFGGRPFRILKFRTMTVRADDVLGQLLAADSASHSEWLARHKLSCDPRVTPLGRLLRLTSIDELPQLINVLRGEMSLVGPRPIIYAERERYGRYFDRYCSVKPGITGLWQVSGRNDTTYRRRVAMDVTYGGRVNLGLDLWILLMTVPAVFAAEGCY